MLIDPEVALTGVHGEIGCIECHGGQGSADFAEAHTDLIADPSLPEYGVCGRCHEEIQEASDNSLHLTLAGYDTVLDARSLPEAHPAIDEMQANHCQSCHSSCGDCHISQPKSVGGGLIEGHAVLETPSMSRQCTACHGSRVKDEYYGLNEGIPGDVHFANRMNCVECHSGDEMHGIGMEGVDHRYSGERTPKCESCHPDAVDPNSEIEYHAAHAENNVLQCQVCHSTTYKNCDSCHQRQTETGQPFYELEASYMDFRIGRNPTPTEERPWLYVVLRHVPVATDIFDLYGENLMANFNALPTWKPATPHNIQRITPQATRCENCHGNPDVFLTADVVAPEELEANASVIVNEVPGIPAGR